MWLLRMLCLFALGNRTFGFDKTQGRIQVFYHIYAAGEWSTIVNDQLTKIAFSGLYNTVQSINCFVVADNQTNLDTASALLSSWGEKFVVRVSTVDDPTYERFTLLKIKPFIGSDDRILYLHSKGVSHNDKFAHNIYWWRNYMEFFLLKEHKVCIRLLEQYDTVGVSFRANHYSGNFWWARGEYYLTLPDDIEEDYVAPEMFLLKNHNDSSKIFSLWQSAVDHYNDAYYPRHFIDSLPSWEKHVQNMHLKV